jgi:hypothetical protein
MPRDCFLITSNQKQSTSHAHFKNIFATANSDRIHLEWPVEIKSKTLVNHRPEDRKN